jgi:hypothetical protein
MTAEIRDLKGERKNEPVPAVVAVLEKALARAKAGDIVGVAVVQVGLQNDFVTNYADNGNWSILHTAAEYFQYHLLRVAYDNAGGVTSSLHENPDDKDPA